jgi:hypothetical protein
MARRDCGFIKDYFNNIDEAGTIASRDRASV